MTKSPGAVYKRDFWADENTKYTRPHHRMLKVARLVNRLAAGKNCRLLDVGCGPATLGLLLDPNMRYYGIDIAIQEPSPNLTGNATFCKSRSAPKRRRSTSSWPKGSSSTSPTASPESSRRSQTSWRHKASSLSAT